MTTMQRSQDELECIRAPGRLKLFTKSALSSLTFLGRMGYSCHLTGEEEEACIGMGYDRINKYFLSLRGEF